MKRVLIAAIVLLSGFQVYSQAGSLQRQINNQVWKPFIATFNNFDTDGFMAVHSREMSRVDQDGNRIYGYDSYKADTKRGNDQANQNNRKRSIELRFIQRIASNNQGFEVGYYKTTSFQPGGKSRSFYGKFHVLLRKENGVWKILMDADANEKTDESIFMQGRPME